MNHPLNQEHRNQELERQQIEKNAALCEADKLAADLEATQQWYAVRFERLKDLARTLPEPVQNEFFAILANGTASAAEPPTYSQQLNALRHERDCLREQVYAYPPTTPFAPDGQTWKQVAELQASRLAQSADAERVIQWIRSDPRRAVLAFTEGPERQIAYAVEDDRRRRLGQ